MKKVIVVVGPTAVGKSHIAVEIAKRLNTEIISGDSVQVFKNLNIGSGKVTEDEMQGVKHHLIDILNIGDYYSVSDFQKHARSLIDKIELPIICGGTGLYVKACLTNYEFSGEARDTEFEKQHLSLTNEELYELLKKADPKQAEIVHPNNRKRVLRALECALNDQKISLNQGKNDYLYKPFIIYLNASRDYLYKKISDRVDKMFEEGLIEENKYLYDNNLTVNAIGYKEFYGYFEGMKTLDEVKEEIKLNSRHLAKRQQTWFNNQMTTNFYEVDKYSSRELLDIILKDIENFLKVGD